MAPLGLPLSTEDFAIAFISIPVVFFGITSAICATVSYCQRGKTGGDPQEVELEPDTGGTYRPYLSKWDVAKYGTGLVCLTFILLLILSAVVYDRLHVAVGIILMFPISCLMFLYFVPHTPRRTTIWWKDIYYTLEGKVRWSPLFVCGGFLVMLIIVLGLNIGLEGACSDNLEIIDTRIARRYMQPTCVPGRPCFVYLTVPRNFASAIIVNHHTTPAKKGPLEGLTPPTRVVYDTESRPNGNYQFTAMGAAFRMPSLEVDRDIHWTHLTGLQPATTYYFKAGPGYDDKGNEVWSEEYKFRTSADDDTPYTFMAGGDMGNFSATAKLTNVAAAQEPLFALVGGDLAYENAKPSCYRLVDSWLGNWMMRMRTPQGYMIPILSTIGNHEVYGDYLATSDQVPFYIRYFPHMDAADDKGVAGIDDRSTYHEHYIGNTTLILALDSGHVAPVDGAQARWLESQLTSSEANSRPFKFVSYHVPMYPTYRKFTTKYSVLVREAWQHVFDAHGVDVSFENHDHAYKRTHMMYNGQPSEQGTLYVGDGCWGTDSRPLPDVPRWYHAKASNTQYVLRVDITNHTTAIFNAMGVNGDVFDSFHVDNRYN